MEAMIMTRIIMHGCNGHMGRVITDLVSKDDECKIVAGIDHLTMDIMIILYLHQLMTVM